MRIPIADKTYYGETAKVVELNLTDDLSSQAMVDCLLLDADDNLIVKISFALSDIAPTSGSSGSTSYTDHWAESVTVGPDTFDFRSPTKLVAHIVSVLDVTPL